MRSTLKGFGLILLTAMAAVSSVWAEGIPPLGSACVQYGPRWTSQEEVWNNPNSSVLNDVHYGGAVNPLDAYLDKHALAELKQRYDDMNRNYEQRQSYGLKEGYGYEEQVYSDQVNALGRDAMHRFESDQGRRTEGNAKAIVENNPNLKPLVAPVALVGGAAALYRGSGVNFKITENFKLRANASVRNRTGSLEMNSPIVQSSIEMKMNSPATLDPTVAAPVDPLSRDERYRFSLFRGLPLDLSSRVTFGTTTSTMSAQLSRRVVDHLTAVMVAAKTLDPQLAVIAPSEQCLKFLYGINF